MVCAVYVCVAPPTHADRFRGGVDPQLSTEGRGGSDGACAPEAGARAFLQWASCYPYAIMII